MCISRRKWHDRNPLKYLRMKSEQNMLIQHQVMELRKDQATLEKQRLAAEEKQ